MSLYFGFFFFNFLAALCLHDLGSPTRDWTHALGSGSAELWLMDHREFFSFFKFVNFIEIMLIYSVALVSGVNIIF